MNSFIIIKAHGGHCQVFIKSHEKKYRVFVIIREKILYKCWNYNSLDEMIHTILYLEYSRWK